MCYCIWREMSVIRYISMKYGRTMQNTLMVQGNFNSRLEATDKLCYNYNGTGFSKHQPFPHGSNYRLV